MKQVTRERIFKALEHNSLQFSNKPEVHIIHTLAEVGMRSAIREATGNISDPFTDRNRLELVYQGFNDPVQIFKRLSHFSGDQVLDSATAIKESWFSSFNRKLEQKWQRDERIRQIQVNHNISGLEKVEIGFGSGRKHIFHVPNEMLALLDRDFKLLYSERMNVAREFVEAARYNGMKLYQHVNEGEQSDWIDVEQDKIFSYAFHHNWAKAWVQRTYIDYQELNVKGYTYPKLTPEKVTDELSLEIHLSIKGVRHVDHNFQQALNDDDEIAWFCGRLGQGKPAL